MLVFSLIPFIVSFNFSYFLCDSEENVKNNSESLCFNEGFFQSDILLDYNGSEIPKYIKPESDIARINISVNHYVSGLYSEIFIPFFFFKNVPIELSINETPEWLNAIISPKIVYCKLRTNLSLTPETAILTVDLTRCAPGFQPHTIIIKARALPVKGFLRLLNIVKVGYNELPITIRPGFFPDFQYSYEPYGEIGPGELLKLPINITSRSNARASINLEILDLHEGWSTSITPHICIGAPPYGEKGNVTTYFYVQSPFECQDEVKQFRVRATSFAAGHLDLGADNTTILLFTVRCRNY